MEVLVGISEDIKEQEVIREFLDGFSVINLNEEIAEIAFSIRKEHTGNNYV